MKVPIVFTLLSLAAFATEPETGANASLHGKRVFPVDNPWNVDVRQWPIDSRSAAILNSIGLDKLLHPDFGRRYGIPYVVVDSKQPRAPVKFVAYTDESDPGPYPIPDDAPIEGGASAKGDRHVLVVDRDAWKLYEIDRAFRVDGGWKADCGAVFDLKSNAQRPTGWTSADAAGLPIFPGLVRYDEVMDQKVIEHALRFTVQRTRRLAIAPASHFASKSNDPNLPPMGMRVRLKAGVDVSRFSPECQVILKALQRYGMILADNGSDWFVSGSPDRRWDDEHLSELKKIRGRDFEVIRMAGDR